LPATGALAAGLNDRPFVGAVTNLSVGVVSLNLEGQSVAVNLY
jgi:hypothetical protein